MLESKAPGAQVSILFSLLFPDTEAIGGDEFQNQDDALAVLGGVLRAVESAFCLEAGGPAFIPSFQDHCALHYRANATDDHRVYRILQRAKLANEPSVSVEVQQDEEEYPTPWSSWNLTYPFRERDGTHAESIKKIMKFALDVSISRKRFDQALLRYMPSNMTVYSSIIGHEVETFRDAVLLNVDDDGGGGVLPTDTFDRGYDDTFFDHLRWTGIMLLFLTLASYLVLLRKAASRRANKRRGRKLPNSNNSNNSGQHHKRLDGTNGSPSAPEEEFAIVPFTAVQTLETTNHASDTDEDDEDDPVSKEERADLPYSTAYPSESTDHASIFDSDDLSNEDSVISRLTFFFEHPLETPDHADSEDDDLSKEERAVLPCTNEQALETTTNHVADTHENNHLSKEETGVILLSKEGPVPSYTFDSDGDDVSDDDNPPFTMEHTVDSDDDDLSEVTA